MVDLKSIRNVAFTGHGGSGKTSIGEAMIFDAGVTTRMGDISSGNTVLDFTEEEIARGISVSTSFYPLAWKKHLINIIDTPGFADFILESKSTMHAADGVVIVIDGVSGVEVITERVFSFARDLSLPRIVFINKLDRDNADFERALKSFRDILGKTVIVTCPIGRESGFKGVVEILSRTAWLFPEDGRKPQKTEIPADIADTVEEYRQNAIEAIAETDDSLMEKYFAEQELSSDELNAALKKATLNGEIFPVFCGSATKNIGIQSLMDGIIDLIPSPEEMPPRKGVKPGTEEVIERALSPDGPFSAFCVKTIIDPFAGRLNVVRVISGRISSDQQVYNSTIDKKEKMSGILLLKGKETEPVKELSAGQIGALVKLSETRTGHTLCDLDNPILYSPIKYPQPVYWLAIEPKSRGDEQRLSAGLQRIAEEDPSFTFERNNETKELVISGMGNAHIAMALQKLKNKFNVEVIQRPPAIAYRETIKGKTEIQGKHKKQTGGRGQYGDCWLRLEPLPRGVGFEFVDEIFGGAIPKNFIPAVEKGCREAMEKGVIAGYPVVDIKITVYDGSYHPVDSSEQAFKTAASKGFKAGFLQAQPILMEPIYNIEVRVPDEFMGDIMGDLSSKRGRIKETDSKGKTSIIRALVPLKELQSYSADLNSITGGRGSFEIEFSHYEEVPPDLARKIIESRKAALAGEEEEE